MKISKDDAYDMFVEYLGEPDNFETEWTAFQTFLENEGANLTDEDAKAFLIELMDNLNPEDETPRKNNLLQAIKAARALLRK